MTVAGKIIYGAGKIVGNSVDYSIKKTGKIISSIAEISGKTQLSINTKKYSEMSGKAVGRTVKVAAAVTAVVVDKTIDVTISTAKYIAENAVETSVKVYGESEEFYDKDKYIKVEYEIVEK